MDFIYLFTPRLLRLTNTYVVKFVKKKENKENTKIFSHVFMIAFCFVKTT